LLKILRKLENTLYRLINSFFSTNFFFIFSVAFLIYNLLFLQIGLDSSLLNPDIKSLAMDAFLTGQLSFFFVT
jgi:hypothetical protein